MSIQLTESSPPGVSRLAGKYLAFHLQGESYGVPVLKVREIIRPAEITMVPQMPAHIRGVINLRGKIIPVMDLGVRLGYAPAVPAASTCIVIVLVKRAGGAHCQMGLIVEAVDEVVYVTAPDLEATPDFGARISTEFILGMAKLKGRVTALLDIDRVMAAETSAQPISL